MPSVFLDNRSLITVKGPEAAHFLHNLVTTDIAGLQPGVLTPGALLTPQGKILFDFLVSRSGDDAFRLDCMAASASDFARRLMLYKLRSKVDLSVEEQAEASVSWDMDPPGEDSLRDSRFAGVDVWRHYGAPEGGDDAGAWTALRIAHGVAEAGVDYEEGDAFPHDAGLDQTGGVSFRKGCFVGQEVVSRMQHRGTARKRTILVRTASGEDLPQPGTEVLAGGKTVGTLTSVAGNRGLAMIRLDRAAPSVAASETILAGSTAIVLSLQEWSKLEWPVADGGETGTA